MKLAATGLAILLFTTASHAQKPRADQGKQQQAASARELRYVLNVPKGWNHWVLADSAHDATWCYTYAGSANVRRYVEDKVGAGKMKTYAPGTIAEVSEKASAGLWPHGREFDYLVIVVSGEDRGKQGWVSTNLVELTAESKRVKAKRDAAEAERRKQAKAEREKKEAAEQARLRAFCGGVYRETIDKKIGDLTVRESEEIEDCRAAGLYPP